MRSPSPDPDSDVPKFSKAGKKFDQKKTKHKAGTYGLIPPKPPSNDQPLWGHESGGPFDPSDIQDLNENINAYNMNNPQAQGGQDRCFRCK